VSFYSGEVLSKISLYMYVKEYLCTILFHEMLNITLNFLLQNGRISKRFPFIYSGSEKEGMVHIKPCTVSQSHSFECFMKTS
jgi:hypothetical protein